ncbi:MAG: NADH-quinone oxidoreductase subunit K [Nitrososphaerales archaeon]|jgi:multicomponent Na+:H+ antiporter subunit C
MVTDQIIFMSTGILLVFIGIASISFSKNLIKTVMSFQVVLLGANLALFSSGLAPAPANLAPNITISCPVSPPFPTLLWGANCYLLTIDSFVFLSILVGAAVEAVGLAIVVNVYRKYGTLNPSEIRKLRH